MPKVGDRMVHLSAEEIAALPVGSVAKTTDTTATKRPDGRWRFADGSAMDGGWWSFDRLLSIGDGAHTPPEALADRAASVAWLRADAPVLLGGLRDVPEALADAIERGECPK